jgi:hypothetical protein
VALAKASVEAQRPKSFAPAVRRPPPATGNVASCTVAPFRRSASTVTSSESRAPPPRARSPRPSRESPQTDVIDPKHVRHTEELPPPGHADRALAELSKRVVPLDNLDERSKKISAAVPERNAVLARVHVTPSGRPR